MAGHSHALLRRGAANRKGFTGQDVPLNPKQNVSDNPGNCSRMSGFAIGRKSPETLSDLTGRNRS